MGLFSVLDVAGTALTAQSVRLNTVASNLANARTVSSTAKGTYRSRQPVFAAELRRGNQQMGVGVKVLGIYEKQTPPPEQYMPEHPLANENGYIYLSNVNTVEEMANMISTSRAYQNSVEAIQRWMLCTTVFKKLNTAIQGNQRWMATPWR